MNEQHPHVHAIRSSPRGCRSTATRPSPPSSCPTAPGRTRSPPTAPRWCAVDLRDGNQALIDPMTPDRKRRMFELLVAHGLQGDRGRLPGRQPDRLRLRPPAHRGGPDPRRRHHPGADPGPRRADRAHLRVACAGAKQAIVHLYNSTSTLQRRVVFGSDRAGHHRHRRPRRRAGAQARRADGRHRDPLRVLPRVLHRHRARLRRRGLQRGHRRLGADRRTGR